MAREHVLRVAASWALSSAGEALPSSAANASPVLRASVNDWDVERNKAGVGGAEMAGLHGRDDLGEA